MVKTDLKQNVRISLFVTEEMDDKIDDLVSIMGMKKNEVIRMMIGTYLAQWEQSIGMVKDKLAEVPLEQLVRR